MSIEAMKLALEALENCVATCFDQYAHEQVMSRPEHFVNQTITALRQAIEQAEQDPIGDAQDRLIAEQAQPVALEPNHTQLKQIIENLNRCLVFDSKAEFLRVWIRDWTAHKLSKVAPPPRQPLVGLTRDERMDIINRLAGQDWVYAVDAIEAKLKENT